jgi:hypothetical protein
MTSSTRPASPVSWLSAALGRLTVVAPRPRPVTARRPGPVTGPRHRAPSAPGEVTIATPEDLLRPGRHLEPEWSRPSFDPVRDPDPFEWLGFSALRH